MSKKTKAIDKLRQNPKNVRFEKIESILVGLGFNRRQEGTNHVVFTYGRYRVLIPARPQQVLPVYVKQVIQIIDALEDESDISNGD
jgi:hypothetical protein